MNPTTSILIHGGQSVYGHGSNKMNHERFRRTFVPTAIRLFNKSCWLYMMWWYILLVFLWLLCPFSVYVVHTNVSVAVVYVVLCPVFMYPADVCYCKMISPLGIIKVQSIKQSITTLTRQGVPQIPQYLPNPAVVFRHATSPTLSHPIPVPTLFPHKSHLRTGFSPGEDVMRLVFTMK